MCLASIAVLQMLHYTPKVHCLKQHIYSHTVFMDQDSGAAYPRAPHSGSLVRLRQAICWSSRGERYKKATSGEGWGTICRVCKLHILTGYWLMTSVLCHMSLSTRLTTWRVAFSRTRVPRQTERERERKREQIRWKSESFLKPNLRSDILPPLSYSVFRIVIRSRPQSRRQDYPRV